MASKLSVSIVGPGSLGGTLALALYRAGYSVREIIYRSDRSRAQVVARRSAARAVRFDEAKFNADLVWICVADAEIAQTAKVMALGRDWTGKYVLHASGALSSSELKALKQKGARVAAVHPMMSFVRSSEASFEKVAFALQGDKLAMEAAAQIAKRLGGTSFELKERDKPLYHVLGAFSSPLLVAQLAAAEKIGKRLGLKPEQTRRVTAPILQKTLSNYLEHGAAAAFSGPLRRGDVETIESHLSALNRVPGAEDIYRALAKMAVSELPVKNKAAIEKLLKPGRRAPATARKGDPSSLSLSSGKTLSARKNQPRKGRARPL